MAKKKLNFKKSESLDLVKKILKEAELSLSDNQRTNASVTGDLGKLLDQITTSEAFSVGAGVAGLAAGGAIGLSLLSTLGVSGLSAAGITSGLAAAGSIIGGGMVAGIGVLAAPAVIIGGTAYAVTNKVRQKKLTEEKDLLLQRVLLAHDKIATKLEDASEKNTERITHLRSMLEVLKMTRHDLEEDLNG